MRCRAALLLVALLISSTPVAATAQPAAWTQAVDQAVRESAGRVAGRGPRAARAEGVDEAGRDGGAGTRGPGGFRGVGRGGRPLRGRGLARRPAVARPGDLPVAGGGARAPGGEGARHFRGG